MMFEDDEDDGFINPEVFHVVRRELYALNANLNVSPFKLRTIPTHTEDGIPIRKLYVANLPPKTTRTELFGLFAQYGFIKSCWVKMSDKGPDRTPSATYAFVTFSNPADAYKALQAPLHERILRGRNLKVSPADSWHQPYEDPDGSIIWKPQQRRNSEGNGPLQLNGEFLEALTDYRGGEENKHAEESEPYTMLDILNNDCLSLVLSYVPIRDLIRSERVSKRWQNMIQEYLQSIRMFKTSWWQHVPVTLTTAVLRRVLLRLGPSLLRLHIDHHWSALNDRTAHTVGKFCPNLEELKVVGMHTKNWNPLIYGCKNLKYLSFVSCNKLTDSSLVHIVKKDSCIERLTVANNTHITGLFLTGSNPPRLSSLEFYNCYSLQGTVLSAALTKMESLTTLKLDVGPVTMWKMVPLIISQLPRLHELSLSEYKTSENMAPVSDEDFCKALAGLTRLKVLNLSRNIHITNAVLKTVAQSCTDLESLNVSSCNSRKMYSNHPAGVSDEGVLAVCGGCLSLKSLDVSYLASLTDAGLSAATRLCSLVSLTARGNPALTAAPFSAVLQSCHMLEEIDACGCDGVSGEVIVVASDELRARPRPLALCLAGTAAALIDSPQVRYWRSEKRYDYRTTRAGREYNVHKLLTVNLHEDRSNPHLRADFVDRLFDDSSDGSFDDVLEHEDFDDFLDEDDDDLFLTDEEDDLEDYEDVLLQIHGQNILLI